MAGNYTPIGIDLGTTNSAIAAMDSDRPRIVRYDGTADIMPSAVYVTSRGRTMVGQQAIVQIMTGEEAEGDGHREFKLRMGQDDRFEFAAARKVMTAPQLSSLVIGELLNAFRKDYPDEVDPKVCVITVPAKFPSQACDATCEAARQAGLIHYPLLQEPIAAALAYGFDRSDKRAYWLVFDLGGGTLDISLIVVRDKELRIPEGGHAGDNHLGGAKFDRELMGHVLAQLKKEYSLAGFAEGNVAYRRAWGRLKLAVERAKIALSERAEAVVEVDGVLCRDEKGREVKVRIPVTRAAYEKLIAADVEKAAYMCESLIKANGLAGSDIDSIVLVGGPTKTPYVQQVLADRLKIRLESTIDPMTVVAAGAALHAAGLSLPDDVRDRLGVSSVTAGRTKLTLQYEPRSTTATCAIAGRVEGDAAADATVEVRRLDGRWSSGRIAVDADGLFDLDVHLIDSGQPRWSAFETIVLDSHGRAVARIDEPKIMYPLPEVVPRLANSLAVAIKDNKVQVLLKAGAALEARGRGTFLTQVPLRKGSKGDVLEIVVLEGVTHLFGEEDALADGHLHVGTLLIKGDDRKLKRDLPQGAEIEVELLEDRSRVITARAYIPLLEEEFEVTFKPAAYPVDLEELATRFEAQKTALAEVRAIHRDKPLDEVAERLATLDRLGSVDAIATDLARASDERDAALRAYKRVFELVGSVRFLQGRQQRVRIERAIAGLRAVVKGDEVKELDTIERDLRNAKPEDVEQIESDLHSLAFKVRTRPHFDLLLDLAALSGLTVSSEQHRLFEKATKLIDRVEAKGGAEGADEADLREMKHVHDELLRAHDDLPARRQQFIDDLPPGQSPRDIGRHLGRK